MIPANDNASFWRRIVGRIIVANNYDATIIANDKLYCDANCISSRTKSLSPQKWD